MSLLKILRDNREAIQLAELDALLHDLDKLNPEFLKDPDHHSRKSLYVPKKRPPQYIDNRKTVPSEKKERWQQYRIPVLSARTPLCGDLVKVVASVDPQQDLSVRLGDAFVYHHDNDPQESHPLLSLLLHAGIGGADGIDSALDKDNAAHEQQKRRFCVDTPFGARECDCTLDEPGAAEAIRALLDSTPVDYKAVRASLKKHLLPALGETRYPCNDVSLWAHSAAVASLTKSQLARVLIEYAHRDTDAYDLPTRSGKKGEETAATDYALCLVTLDRNHLWSRAEKAGDVIGIAQQLLSLQEGLEDYYENDLLLGNAVYRDQERQLFLLPRLGSQYEGGEDQRACRADGKLQRKLEEELYKSLSDFITNWLVKDACQELPFSIRLSSAPEPDLIAPDVRILRQCEELLSKSAVTFQSVSALASITHSGPRCPVCGVRSRSRSAGKDTGLCDSCASRRHQDRKLAVGWTSDLERLLRGTSCNKLALIRLSFGLENLYDGTCFSISKVTWRQRNTFVSKNMSPGRLQRCWDTTRRFLQNAREIALRHCEVLFPITLDPTPDRMEFVIRADKTMEVIQDIYRNYEQEFGKFRDRLPLSVGCIFFYQKFPLYVAMEAARGMSKAFDARTPRAHWKAQAIPIDAKGTVQIRLKSPKQGMIGDMAGWAVWNVPARRSDGELDKTHARFAGKYVSELVPDDDVEVYEGYFDFVLAEGAESRQAFTSWSLAEANGGSSSPSRRHHILGRRNCYPLASILEFDRVWQLVRQLPPAQASNIEGLLVEKMRSWGEQWNVDDETVQQFCKLLILAPNAFGKKDKAGKYTLLEDMNGQTPWDNCSLNVLVRAAANGVLLDVLDLYVHLCGCSTGGPKPPSQKKEVRQTPALAGG